MKNIAKSKSNQENFEYSIDILSIFILLLINYIEQKVPLRVQNLLSLSDIRPFYSASSTLSLFHAASRHGRIIDSMLRQAARITWRDEAKLNTHIHREVYRTREWEKSRGRAQSNKLARGNKSRGFERQSGARKETRITRARAIDEGAVCAFTERRRETATRAQCATARSG